MWTRNNIVLLVCLLSVSVACTERAAESAKAHVGAALDATKSGADKAIDATKAAGDKAAGAAVEGVARTSEAAGAVADKAKDAATATGNALTDPFITGKLKAKFADEIILKGSHIDIDTKAHVVTLSGSVGSELQKERAGVIAAGTVGVVGVVNQLVVK
jgi:osmotically-inducible protein OsmY